MRRHQRWPLRQDFGYGKAEAMSKSPTIKRRRSVFEIIPGIGPSLAKDLEDLGFKAVEELRNADPERMYRDLCALRGGHQDRCVLYTFRCAVYYASYTTHDPELLKWWTWKDF